MNNYVEVLIKIPEKEYADIMYNEEYARRNLNHYERIISAGVELPKGHGELVDYRELKNNAREYGAYAEATLSHIKPKTIIEADKAVNEP